MSATAKTVILLAMVLLAGCGYLRSGRWEDDPGNWSRAFRSTKPDDVVVVRSLYWRAPHWTFEGGYLFEIEPNAALRAQLFSENPLRRLQDAEIKRGTLPCFDGCPPWFAPEPLETYEIWTYSDIDSRFRVLIDKYDGRIFLGDYQI